MAAEKRHFINHLHPRKIKRTTLRPLSTLGLGIASLACFGVLIVTGLTLLSYYIPDQAKAYEQILHITTTIRYGNLLRNLHYFSANALLILSGLHLVRVVLTGGYKGRRLVWYYGLGLFSLILLSNFTGYLLSWDQISYWAVKVGSNLVTYLPVVGTGLKHFILAGDDIGHDILPRTVALHAGILPLLFLLLTALHLWRLRKSGGLSSPATAKSDLIPAQPWLYRAEGAVALLTLSSLLFLSSHFDAPLFDRADPFHPPNPAKAPWYFVGFQEMVSHSALLGGVIIPVMILLFIFLVPVFDRSKSSGGIWFAQDRWCVNLIFLIIIVCQLILIILGQYFRGANWLFEIPFS